MNIQIHINMLTIYARKGYFCDFKGHFGVFNGHFGKLGQFGNSSYPWQICMSLLGPCFQQNENDPSR